MVAERTSGRILGIHILAPNAGEVIPGRRVRGAGGMTVEDVAGMWCPYLTISETVKLAAQSFTTNVRKLSCCAARPPLSAEALSIPHLGGRSRFSVRVIQACGSGIARLRVAAARSYAEPRLRTSRLVVRRLGRRGQACTHRDSGTLAPSPRGRQALPWGARPAVP